jgi:TRAP-type C4-dicarboxylate transport system substrate-binding protein
MKYMRALDKRILEKTGDRLGFRFFPGGVAGDELDVLRRIRVGQIHCAAFSGVGFGQILPAVRVLDLPFLFRSHKEIDKVHGALRPFFSEQFRKKGFELLGWAEIGNVHLFSKHAIQTIADLSQRKVWTWSGDPIAKEAFVAMDVNPIPLAVTDVTTALNTGMIDTVYSPPLGALALQWYVPLEHMTALPFVHSTGAVLISSRFIKKLPRDLTKILKDEFEKTLQQLTVALREQTAESVKLMQQQGLMVTPSPSGEPLNAFYRIHGKVASKMEGKMFSSDLLQRVYGILGRSR